MPSVPWRVEFSKIFHFFFKIPKMPKIVPKSIQTCFERVLGQTFRKYFAPFSTAFRILENFQKNRKKFQNSKNAKIVPKRIQTCFDCNLDNFFEKFLPSFPWKVESSKIFKKKCFQNSKIAQKCSQKYPNVF